jgi:predicted CXXCH cytochrome family protein
MRSSTDRFGDWLAAALVLVVVLVVSCTDEEVVYKDRTFPPPAANAGSFMGFSSEADTLTVCGNCHIGQQAEWQQTAHAHAWSTLANSGAMQDFCQACHTVNNLGNATTDTAVGYRSTKDARYHDVQCESCHGPGEQHVTNPDDEGAQPIASLAADSASTTGCGGCHNGAHHGFVNEWQKSAHGTMPHWSATGPNTRAECQGCHTGQGALVAWGVTSRYKEQNLADGDTLPITCGVCHDPHNATYEGQLRYPIDVPSPEQNLCMKCHQRRAVPELTSSRGPHSPEGPLLLGEDVGWIPPGFSLPGGVDQIVGTHGTGANPRLCAGCHVDRYTVNDTLTGQFKLNVFGHRFLAIPCVTADTIPTDAQDCGEDLQQRTFRACSSSGCHGTEDQARAALGTGRARIQSLVDELNRLLALVPPTEFSTTDNVLTTAEGAQFNAQLAALPGSVVHNPFMIEALLTASIAQVEKDYGVTASRSVSLTNILSR